MTKKALIFGLCTVVLTVLVGGAFGATDARADAVYPYGGLACSPSTQSANSGDLVNFSAYYLYPTSQLQVGTLTWQVLGGTPSSGTGQTFSTRFYPASINETRTVTVTDGYQTATCTVFVNGSTPTPTPVYGYVSINHSVSNMTRGGSGTSVTAYNGDRLQFIVRITTVNQYASNVYVRDWLPQYVNYLAGTTSVDGAWYPDGITTDSLRLNTLSPNRTTVVQFEATVNGAYMYNNNLYHLTNTINVHVDGTYDQSRTSNIDIAGGSYYTPTPTPTPYGQNLFVTEFGRNVTRGQSGEHTALIGHSNDTLDILLHVRASSTNPLYNVYVTDVLPMGLNYILGSTTVNGIVGANGITSSGLNIGTLGSNQEAIVRFSVTVDPNFVPTWGQVDLTNTAQVRADGVNTVSARLPIILGNALSIAAISQIKTGPADSILLALLVSVVVTGLYAIYTNTEMFGRRLSLAQINQRIARKDTPNFLP